MFEYIKDAYLKPSRPYTLRKATDLIVLHHVEGNLSVEDVHRLHLERGHKGIDYNIYIDKDGSVYWGRGLEYEGGHVANNRKETAGVNARSVGIVCNGNFLIENMGDIQKEALKTVVNDVVLHYGFKSASQIVSHREIAGENYTDCPGKLPVEEIREFIRKGGRNSEKDDLIWKVNAGVVNLREKADLNSRIIKKLYRGDSVKLERYVKGEEWARVNVNGVRGYVWLEFLSPSL